MAVRGLISGTSKKKKTLTPEEQEQTRVKAEQQRESFKNFFSSIPSRALGLPVGAQKPESTPIAQNFTSAEGSGVPSSDKPIQKPQAPPEPQIIRNADTGKPTFIKKPDGSLVPFDEAIVNKFTPFPTPPGFVEATDVNFQEQLRARWQEALRQLQQPLPAVQAQGNQLDLGQALAAGGLSSVIGAGGGLLTGAAGGAFVGGAASAGIGAIPGAVIGGVAGILLGARSNIATQIQEENTARVIELREGEQNLNAIMTEVNAGRLDPISAVRLYRQNIIRMLQAHANLKMQTQTTLSKFTAKDGTKELQRFNTFFQSTLPLIELEFIASLANPDPNKILKYGGVFRDDEDSAE